MLSLGGLAKEAVPTQQPSHLGQLSRVLPQEALRVRAQAPRAYPHNKPGQRCTKWHTTTCWMKLDDEWLAAHPTKTGADLPDRLAEQLAAANATDQAQSHEC